MSGTAAELSVAIVGMACRLPGAPDPWTFWRNLMEGRGSIRRFTLDEIRAAGGAEAILADPAFVPAHGYLEGYDLFDARRFGVSPREAELMDPQHRLLLECSAEALQDAGRDAPTRRRELLTGVFAGVTISTYFTENVLPRRDLRAVLGDQQIMLACDKDFAVLRVAHAFDARGPAVGIQAACASSLAAVNAAMRSLLSGECDLALAGGASVRAPQVGGYLHLEGGTGSPDGSCRAFDARAGGSVAGSGTGMVVLRRLADALADGDRIHAVLRGAAVTNDGADKPNLMVPTVAGQVAAMEAALAFAQIPAEQVRVLEAHGTGTKVGDPIEAAAFARVYTVSGSRPAYLGTVKPSIGHLDAAAGIAGLIRVVLSLKARIVPPVYGFKVPNPECRLQEAHLVVPTAVTPLETEPSAPVFGAVNSIGMGGVNVHVILESPPPPTPRPLFTGPVLLPLSAGSEDGLRRAVERLEGALVDPPDLRDVSFTLSSTRAHLPYRTAVTGRDAGALRRALRRIAPFDGSAPAGETVAFLFPGQAQADWTVFTRAAAELPALDRHLRSILAEASDWMGMPLVRLLDNGPDPSCELHRQITVLAGPLALARALADAGLLPTIATGTSMGEITAAVAAGGMSLQAALRLVEARVVAFAEAPEGAMMVSMPRPKAALPEGVWVAIVQSPEQVVYGGVLSGIEALAAQLKAEGKAYVRLRVSHAFHTPLMREAAASIATKLGPEPLGSGEGVFLGSASEEDEGCNAALPAYWAQQIARPLRLDRLLLAVAGRQPSMVVDLDPGQGLLRLMRTAGQVAGQSAPMGDVALLYLHQLGHAWARGYAVTLPTPPDGRVTSLPPTPFDHRRYWLDPKCPEKEKDLLTDQMRSDGVTMQVGVDAVINVYADRVEIRTGAAAREAAVHPAPAPPPEARSVPGPAAASVRAPASAEDRAAKLGDIVGTFLGVETAGEDDNLFDLGATSLTMTQMIAEVRRRTGVSIALADAMAAPTLRGLRELVGAESANQIRDGTGYDGADDIQAELDIVEKLTAEEVEAALSKG